MALNVGQSSKFKRDWTWIMIIISLMWLIYFGFFKKDIPQEYKYLNLNTYDIYTKRKIPKFTAKLLGPYFGPSLYKNIFF